MFQPWKSRTPRNRRVIIVSVGLAVIIHVGAFAWFRIERNNRALRTPPSVSASRPGETSVAVQAGLPMSKEMHRHRFRVITELNGQPVAGARVTDVFANTEGYTDGTGVATIPVRPGAKLVAHIERPGYAKQAAEFPNINMDHEHTVILKPKPVVYASVDSGFVQRCVYCHGAVGRSGEVDLTTYEKAMASTAGGTKIIVPYNPDSSRLVRVLRDVAGPDGKPARHLKQTSPPDAFAIEMIAEWIREGARRK